MERVEPLPFDPIVGIRRRLGWDPSGRRLLVMGEQDCDEILAWNRALFNAERSSSSLWGGRSYVKVASIPNAVVEEWHQRGVSIYKPEGRAKILAWLSSNEYSHFRTAPGRLG